MTRFPRDQAKGTLCCLPSKNLPARGHFAQSLNSAARVPAVKGVGRGGNSSEAGGLDYQLDHTLPV